MIGYGTPLSVGLGPLLVIAKQLVQWATLGEDEKRGAPQTAP